MTICCSDTLLLCTKMPSRKETPLLGGYGAAAFVLWIVAGIVFLNLSRWDALVISDDFAWYYWVIFAISFALAFIDTGGGGEQKSWMLVVPDRR
jgi:hypothetical protein